MKDFPGGSVVKNLLPVQQMCVQSLVQEGPTGHGATEHPEPMATTTEACAP